ncbi:PP2C family protein-serine/threonine phosphatase [Chondromyces apiculatus]|uniref:HAMP domain-containing protein n=1 Tax=Chondromyces apiculatus DSM 436 TaxID=1192034 RepID=A0A017TBZ1_9BACT|nr:SpoIIE family protein phosphatase [Chondromyces apiculatus]EYF06808.1 Hypothetical protein CAP_1505 [Chondromyces apiculatus DSM 436]
MRFRSLLLLGVVALIAGSLGGTVLLVAAVLHASARTEIAADLSRGRDAFLELKAQRDARRRSETRVVAEEPRLKAVVATEDVSQETTFGVAYELRKAVGSDLFLLTDGDGRLLADVLDPTAQGYDLKEIPLVAAALVQGESSAVWTQGARVYEVEARRLSFGATAVGVLVLGDELDDAEADRVARVTGCEAVVLQGGVPAAASRSLPGSRESLGSALGGISAAEAAAPVEVLIGGARHLALWAPMPGVQQGVDVRLVMLRSLDQALLPAVTISRRLYGFALLSLAAGVILAVLLSKRLSRPLDALVDLTRQLAAGALDARTVLAGPVEVQVLGQAMNRMAGELEASREALVAKERLEQELEISTRIQTSILPRSFDVDGLEVAAQMITAAEVGGDYMDVIPARGGTWIAIGDVAGHGLRSGLVMIMLQSAVSALAREQPLSPPSELLRAVNRVLYDNIRNRLGNDEHVTLTLLRYRRDGLFTFAGAHEEILVYRAATGKCELIPTPGPWVGAIEDIGAVTVDSRLQLEDGDVMVLYTDGITEARNEAGKLYGLDPLVAAIEAHGAEPVDRIRDEILVGVAEWAVTPEDDVTLLVMRYRSPQTRLA